MSSVETKTIIVQAKDEDTFKDLVGSTWYEAAKDAGDTPPSGAPSYILHSGRPVEINGIVATSAITESALVKDINIKDFTFKLLYPISSQVKYFMNYIDKRNTLAEKPENEREMHPGTGDVYLINRDETVAQTSDGTGDWFLKAKDTYSRGIGFENHTTAVALLYEEVGGKRNLIQGIDKQYWIPGKGVISPTPAGEKTQISIWFDLKGAEGKVSTVDQSDKYTLTLELGGGDPKTIIYDPATTETGWPLQSS